MPTSVKCRNCNTPLPAPDSEPGGHVTCRACGWRVPVPEAPKAAEVRDDSRPQQEAKATEDPDLLDGSLLIAEVVTPQASEPSATDADRAGQAADSSDGKASDVARRPCPMCGELIVATAAKCRFCGAFFDEQLRRESRRAGGRNDLRTIAARQKAIMICILVDILSVAAVIALPRELKILPAATLVIAGIASVVYVFLLSMSLYSVGTGVILGLLTFIPYVGLVVLVTVSAKATRELREYGYKVGFMGADMSQF
jgi:hypothetical protein